MTECILTPYYKDKDGYGLRRYKGKYKGAHRIAYCEAHNIEIDLIDGKVVLHSCDNPACVNPDHLSLGTHQDNVADKVRKGRQRTGRFPIRHKGVNYQRGELVSDETKEEIRKCFVHSSKDYGVKPLARKFNMYPRYIREIVSKP